MRCFYVVWLPDILWYLSPFTTKFIPHRPTALQKVIRCMTHHPAGVPSQQKIPLYRHKDSHGAGWSLPGTPLPKGQKMSRPPRDEVLSLAGCEADRNSFFFP